MSQVRYRQCELRKGPAVQVAWIPAAQAVPGKVLRLREEEGWRVTQVYAELDAKTVELQIGDARRSFPSIEGNPR